MTERENDIAAFLTGAGWQGSAITPMAGDASSRLYSRLERANQRAVLMDHPPDQGSITPFLSIARHLRDCGLNAPEIYAADEALGLILMEDLGNAVYSHWLRQNPDDEGVLYEAAVDVLYHLHQHPAPDDLQLYGPQMMAQYIAPTFEFYVGGDSAAEHFQFVSAELETNLRELAPETDCIILRDFHADNLIWLPDRKGVARVGLLDFQDALLGHHSYDLASLIQDARRDVSAQCAAAMIRRYAGLSGRPIDNLTAAVAVQGAQRNLRILGIFARLSRHGGKCHYVDMIPRVWALLMENLSHPSLQALRLAVLSALPEPDSKHLQGLRAQQ